LGLGLDYGFWFRIESQFVAFWVIVRMVSERVMRDVFVCFCMWG